MDRLREGKKDRRETKKESKRKRGKQDMMTQKGKEMEKNRYKGTAINLG